MNQLLNLKTLAIFFLRLNTLAELVALQLFTIVQLPFAYAVKYRQKYQIAFCEFRKAYYGLRSITNLPVLLCYLLLELTPFD